MLQKLHHFRERGTVYVHFLPQQFAITQQNVQELCTKLYKRYTYLTGKRKRELCNSGYLIVRWKNLGAELCVSSTVVCL